jgi:hypothetical protein
MGVAAAGIHFHGIRNKLFATTFRCLGIIADLMKGEGGASEIFSGPHSGEPPTDL